MICKIEQLVRSNGPWVFPAQLRKVVGGREPHNFGGIDLSAITRSCANHASNTRRVEKYPFAFTSTVNN